MFSGRSKERLARIVSMDTFSRYQHSRTARTTFKAYGFSEPPETIRAIRFFRAARNNSGYPVLSGCPKRFGLPEFSSRSKQIRATRCFGPSRILRIPGSARSVEPSQARLALFEYPNSSSFNIFCQTAVYRIVFKKYI